MRWILALVVLTSCAAPAPIVIDPASCEPAAVTGGPTPTFDGALWQFGVSPGPLYCPVPGRAGDEIGGLIAFGRRAAPSSIVAVQFDRLDVVSSERIPEGPNQVDAAGVGDWAIAIKLDPPLIISEDDSLAVRFTGSAVDGIGVGATVVYGGP